MKPAAMSRVILLTSCSMLHAPVIAGESTFKPLLDLRLRHEGVDQAGIANEAEAVTVRARAGFEISRDAFSFLAEAEGTEAIDEDYNSGLNGNTTYPLVADPENAELNRLQVQYKGFERTTLTAGRQRINLDDQRFVGSVGWRDNEQTFDAARVEWTGPSQLKLDATYAWSVRTIWGEDGTGNRPTAIDGDNLFGNLSFPTSLGLLSGFAYLIDQDEAAVFGKRLSSRTFGARLAGARQFTSSKLNYAFSHARQSDYHDNPNRYSADYWLLDGSVDVGTYRLGAGYEVLGADEGLALTSFQTPLATGHKFQGWADRFLVTPPDGVRDLYASAAWNAAQLGAFTGVSLGAVWHQFDSDRGSQDYGSEVDLIATAKFKRFSFLAKYSDYEADQLGPDVRKLWLQSEWMY